ncbi:hypothetical protein Spith_0972 [Spirochaeta thermophila DSM 6578]|uniref:Transmembrane protein n=2 Tax=Winmispira thermophila TaxID=154 RepID=G0GCV3_WINT7|nr:hypothetical protein Spith_0972 [Spirochaeta thermophila DSM 6578]
MSPTLYSKTMIGFLIKKAFFDTWDHLITVVVLNLGFLLSFAIPTVVPEWVSPLGLPVVTAVVVVGLVITFLYLGMLAMAAKEIAFYRTPSFDDLLSYLTHTWKGSLVFGGLTALAVLIPLFFFPFYASWGGAIGFIGMVILLWALIGWSLMSVWFYPLLCQIEPKVRKVLKKSFLLALDNPGLSIVLILSTPVILFISIFTALLVPGPAGLMVWLQDALKLRMYKYEYLEAHPDADRKKIPWETLLIEERERVGKRTLKGMFFPWKE